MEKIDLKRNILLWLMRFILILCFILKLFFLLYYGMTNLQMLKIVISIFIFSNLITLMVWINKNKHIEFLKFQKKILLLQPEKKLGADKQKHEQLLDSMIYKISPNAHNVVYEQGKFWIKFVFNQIFTLSIYGFLCYFNLYKVLCIYLVIGIVMSVFWHWIIIQKQLKNRKLIEVYLENIFSAEQ